MKRTLFTYLFLVSISTLFAQEVDSIIDVRDGQKYGIVKIGYQWWISENLNYYIPNYSWYYNDDSLTYADTLGRLYNWEGMWNVCPSGWVIPSDDDWKELEIFLGMDSEEADQPGGRGTDEGSKLKYGGESGFNALFAGQRTVDETYSLLDEGAYFWTSDGIPGGPAYSRDISSLSSTITRDLRSGFQGLSLRCTKALKITVISNISCHGLADGIANATQAGDYYGDNTYLWDDDLNSTNSTVTGLSANKWYHVIVTTRDGIMTTDSVMLSEPDPINISKDYSSKACTNANDGYISLYATGGTEPYYFSWSNGLDTNYIEDLAPGKYYVDITDQNGCSISDTTVIDSISTYQESEICMVTVNSQNRIVVVWEKTYNKGIAQYNIYREQTMDNYIKIGSVPFNDLSIFIDESSIPDEYAHWYKISITDSCGIESKLSQYHKSIHLQTSVGLSAEVNLNWDKYEGFNYPEYEIFRGTSFASMFSIRSITASARSWTDTQPITGQNYYRIMVVKPTPCLPTGLKSDEYAAPFSNLDTETIVGINELSDHGLIIYPNPFTDKTTIHYPNPNHEIFQLILIDLTGKVLKLVDYIAEDKIEINRDGLSDGLYLIELRGPRIYRSKILIE